MILCIDRIGENKLEGQIWHGYRTEPVMFRQWYQVVMELESFFDEIQFPFPSTNFRSFDGHTRTWQQRQEKTRMMKDDELLKKRGDLGTFILRVQHRQNSSWQGRITWMEEDKTVYFRSIWEMIKLVENALDSVGAEMEDVAVSWDEEGKE